MNENDENTDVLPLMAVDCCEKNIRRVFQFKFVRNDKIIANLKRMFAWGAVEFVLINNLIDNCMHLKLNENHDNDCSRF